MLSDNPLTQKINFAVSAVFVMVFGSFMTVTVVQAMTHAALFGTIASPVSIDLGEE